MNNLENEILNAKIKSTQQDLEKVFIDRKITHDDKKKSFAFVVYSLMRFLNNYSIDEVIENVVDGSGDNGIDVINICDNSDSEGRGEIIINLFQMKFFSEKKLNSTIGERDINEFINKIKSLFIQGEIQNIKMNSYFEKQYKYFKDIVQAKSPSDIKIRLFLVTNGGDVDKNSQSILDTFRGTENIISDWEIKNDYSFFIDSKEKEIKEVKLDIANDQKIQMSEDVDAVVINVKTYELVKLYLEFGETILNKNVRKLLKSKANEEIANSIRENPKMFWYKNNGLSIVCRRKEINTVGGRKEITLENPYIVNGAQTTKTIYNLFKEINPEVKSVEDLKDVNVDKEELNKIFYDSCVMARVYQTTDIEKISEIVYGTNNQNKITSYDLKSLNPNLIKIKKFFETENITLLIQRDSEERKLKRNINSDTLLQVYCSIYKNIPHTSKNNKNKLIEDYYEEVYKDNNNYKNLLNAFLIYEFVREKIKDESRGVDYDFINHALHSIIYFITAIIPSLKDKFNYQDAEDAYKNCIKELAEIVKKQKSEDEKYANHNFFKSSRSTEIITNIAETDKWLL